MSFRGLSFVLLICFAGVLQAQYSSPCPPPNLVDGFLALDQVSYAHRTKLTYACEGGKKPAVEGWWATITCENGEWSHKPECIDENACLPPDIPNAKYKRNVIGRYNNGEKILITCDDGYAHQSPDAAAQCNNGTWLSVPVCEKSIDACVAPPKIPHAVVIHQRFQNVFADGSKVWYDCKYGYVTVGTIAQQSLSCSAGQWSEHQPCKPKPPVTVGAASGSGSTPGTGHSVRPPTVEDGGANAHGRPTAGGAGGRPTGGGAGTTGREPSRPGGSGTPGGSSLVSRCGDRPLVPNGDVVEETETYLRYQCAAFYKLEGPDRVMCHSHGTWSQLPSCTVERFCVVNPGSPLLPQNFRPLTESKVINENKVEIFYCYAQYYSKGRCENGLVRFTQCCHDYYHQHVS
ncbi:complement factor H-like isoform X3 [Genypterus blacodes]|uniref:complement factor H-like isoform X3 n=1 Tax=Genypterus blacodes TaxID=154954 RepID=UPI003F75D70B